MLRDSQVWSAQTRHEHVMRVFRLEAAEQEVRDARFDIDLDEVATAAERRLDPGPGARRP